MNVPETLKDNEYLLKIRPKDNRWTTHDTGFLTKYNKNGSMPKSFLDWGRTYGRTVNSLPEITLHVEDFNKGWKIVSWRFGESQNWATMLHPDGFTVEIYLQNLLELINTNTIKKGVLVGEFKWEDKKLIKR